MRRRGFTMVELMVALAVGAVVMAGVFIIFQRSSSAFRVQGQIQRMNDDLRSALSHVRADLKMAGFLATPNSAVDPLACPATDPLQALSLELPVLDGGDDSDPVVNRANNTNVQPLSLTLLGPYHTARVFRTASVSSNQVTLLTADSLEVRANYPGSQAEFDALFVPGRLLKLVNQDQRDMYVSIQAAEYGSGLVVVDPALQPATADNTCGYQADGSRMEVALLSFVRYRVGRDVRPGAPRNKTDLIREELRLAGHDLVPVAGSQLHVAEFVVDLMLYDFVFDVGTAGAPNLLYYPTYDEGGVLNGDGTGRLERGSAAIPEKLRFVTVKLSTRTPEEDPSTPFFPRAQPFGPLRLYEVNPAMNGCAAVESLATRVELTTFRQRGL
jgi:prepilin-type N-terminal cleavage/methylation domain-containing protein